MEGNSYVDLFLTKGDEYILVIGFLLTLIFFWRLLSKPTGTETAEVLSPGRESWFQILSDRFYHRGHAWAKPEKNDLMKIGMDDFSQMLVGRSDKIDLPRIGSKMIQGGVGWSMHVSGKRIPFLSPVEGEVVEVNDAIRKQPGLASEDPYDKGWIAVVRTPQQKRVTKNLLTAGLARTWMDQTVDAVRAKATPDLGMVYQDGGVPVPGFVRQLSPARWDEVAAEFFLTQ